jgi:hypothetical protein
MSLAPPPAGLSDAEIARLDLCDLPADPGVEPVTVYQFEDTGEFVADDDETEKSILDAFPHAKVRRTWP